MNLPCHKHHTTYCFANREIGNHSSHHGGMWSASKLFFAELFPNVDYCIQIDTDMLVHTDIQQLWKDIKLLNLNPNATIQMISINEELNIHTEDEICSCIGLQNLKRMRDMQNPTWYEVLLDSTTKEYGGELNRNSDQSVYYAVMKHQQEMEYFLMLDVSWNLSLCHEFYNYPDTQYLHNQPLFFGTMHLNCLGEDSFHQFVEEPYRTNYPLLSNWTKDILTLRWDSLPTFTTKHTYNQL